MVARLIQPERDFPAMLNRGVEETTIFPIGETETSERRSRPVGKRADPSVILAQP